MPLTASGSGNPVTVSRAVLLCPFFDRGRGRLAILAHDALHRVLGQFPHLLQVRGSQMRLRLPGTEENARRGKSRQTERDLHSRCQRPVNKYGSDLAGLRVPLLRESFL